MDLFMSQAKQTALQNHNVAYTENGAKMYGTTGHALLDLNFSVSLLRSCTEDRIVDQFMLAFRENPDLAMKWLFYARDVREGLGERRLFRVIIKHYANYPCDFGRLLQYIPVYGRWDDLFVFFGTYFENDILRIIAQNWHRDLDLMKKDQPISLMAKWLPSINATAKESTKQAIKIQRYLGIPIPVYRKQLAKFRKYLHVVETKMSKNLWDTIDYATVPGRANLLYSDAFMRHDGERRQAYLDSVIKGEAKMNAGTVYPHEIVHKILSEFGCYSTDEEINSLRAMWESLPDVCDGGRTMVIADGSGSMKKKCNPHTEVTCLEVAMALAIYFSERMKGPFKDTFITFSEHPQFVDLQPCTNIQQKLLKATKYNEVANTNIEAVFSLILNTALARQLKQEELPDNLLIISDMEFDSCVESNDGRCGDNLDPNLFEAIAAKYRTYGYKLPRICFWNVYGRSGAVPMTQNELGVALMSGYSINNAKLIMSGNLDPYAALVEILNSERYQPITVNGG